MELVCGDEVFAVVGAAMEVRNILGNGFLEAVYQEAMEHELALRGVTFQKQPEIRIRYKASTLKQSYKPDLLVYDRVIVELKTIEKIGANEEAQLLNYLHATGMQVGVLINFGSRGKLEWKRMVLTGRVT